MPPASSSPRRLAGARRRRSRTGDPRSRWSRARLGRPRRPRHASAPTIRPGARSGRQPGSGTAVRSWDLLRWGSSRGQSVATSVRYAGLRAEDRDIHVRTSAIARWSARPYCPQSPSWIVRVPPARGTRMAGESPAARSLRSPAVVPWPVRRAAASESPGRCAPGCARRRGATRTPRSRSGRHARSSRRGGPE